MKRVIVFATFWGSAALCLCAYPQESVRYDEYRITGPYTANNLSLFFFHNSSESHLPRLLTLNEALSAGTVTVFETGSVKKLEIENKSGMAVFVQSGDLVKGGRQDRVMVYDLILEPHSARKPLPVFCVESHRWSPRPDDSGTVFTNADNVLASRELKVATKVRGSQREVWDCIENEIGTLPEGLHIRGAIVNKGLSYYMDLDFKIEQHDSLIKTITSQMNRSLEKSADVVGIAFAINGEINSADIYGDTTLFKQLWPNLIKACATEAAGSYRKDDTTRASVGVADLVSWMKAADDVETREQVINDLTTLTIKQGKNTSVFETRTGESHMLIHKNYLRIE